MDRSLIHDRADDAVVDVTSSTTWQKSLRHHLDSLQRLLDAIDPTEVEVALELIRSCAGVLILTGVGQNLILAQKIAATYSSLSLPAHGVDPVSAMHGQFGALGKDDLVILLSRSGETEELLQFARHRRATCKSSMLLIHSNPGCTLESVASASVFLPVDREADHLNLAPTASSVCILALLQSLAVQLAAEKHLDHEQFLALHPGGTLGKGIGKP